MKNKIRFLAMMLIGVLLSVNQVWGATATVTTGTYKKQSGTSITEDGSYILLFSGNYILCNTNAGTNYVTQYSYGSAPTSITIANDNKQYVWVVSDYSNGSFKLVGPNGEANGAKSAMSVASSGSTWTMDGSYIKTSDGYYIKWVSSSGFRCYNTSGNKTALVAVYKLDAAPSCTNKVTVTKGAATGGSYTLKAGSASGAEISSGGTVDNCDANATIVVVPNANSHYHCTGVTASNSTSVTGPDGSGNYTITYTKGSNINSTVNVTFTEDAKYTVNWYANDQLKGTQTNYQGTTCTAPTTPTTSDCDGSKVFVGWTATQDYEHATTAPPDLFTDPTTKTIPEGGTNYYAVFADAGSGGGTSDVFEMLSTSSSVTAGDYVIINSDGNRAMSSDFNSGTSGEFKGVSVSPSNNKVTVTNTKLIWTFEEGTTSGQFSLKNNSTNTYASIKGTSSTDAALSNDRVYFTFGTSSTDNIWKVKSVSYSARGFSYYSNNTSFRTYAHSSNNTGYLYKRSSGGTTYTNYATSCGPSTYTVNYSGQKVDTCSHPFSHSRKL
ncbi:MAG: hypothetical protein MJZ79_06990 [Paludibacteraceae bacterium]|nr:hypothetical protein [Paludibacteraceae bacterium]